MKAERMPISKSLRWAAAFAAACSLSTVAPASASAALDDDLKVSVADVFVSKTVRSSGYETRSPAPLEVHVSAAQPIRGKVTTTFDTSGLAAVANASIDSSPFDKCEQVGAVITCVTNTGHPAAIGLKAFPDAPVGASGVVKITVEADGRRTVRDEATATVAEDVQIYEANTPSTPGPLLTKPGEEFTVGMQLRGFGGFVHGVVAVFDNDSADDLVAVRKTYSNCTYEGDHLRTCTFRQRVDPARGQRVDLPFKAREPIFRPTRVSLDYRLWPLTEWAARQASSPVDVGTPGQGGVLRILNTDNTAAPATDRNVPQVNTNRQQSIGSINIPMDAALARHYLAAVGDTVSGNPGDTVSVRFGIQNRSRFDYVKSYGLAYPNVLVVLPVGVTVLEKPSGCEKYVESDPNDEPAGPNSAGGTLDLPENRDMLLCDVESVIRACDQATFTVKLRIDKASPIEGRVYGGWQSPTMDFPLEADLVVQDAGSTSPVAPSPATPCAAPDPTTPAPSSSPDPATPAPSPSQDDTGGLPITGGQVGVVAGVGAALAVLGVLLTLSARRRRIRLTI
ncbi:hypothetical protein [Micromonospora sp. NBRC 107095]|uniref:hypothetical protein n=1 Tax=Micromonospora sp. NBRC 107095 TaxID=3032209 RepID=UPI002552A568|nr:hypothetical protein [Micromonospora sp. NBRC 107095]